MVVRRGRACSSLSEVEERLASSLSGVCAGREEGVVESRTLELGAKMSAVVLSVGAGVEFVKPPGRE